MQINGGSIPFHVAKAYGVTPSAAPRPAAARPAAPVEPATPAARTATVGPASTSRSSQIDALIGGRVPGRVSFDGGSGVTNAAASARAAGPTFSLPLYTRAADRIEAATGVNLGRTLDVRG